MMQKSTPTPPAAVTRNASAKTATAAEIDEQTENGIVTGARDAMAAAETTMAGDPIDEAAETPTTIAAEEGEMVEAAEEEMTSTKRCVVNNGEGPRRRHLPRNASPHPT